MKSSGELTKVLHFFSTVSNNSTDVDDEGISTKITPRKIRMSLLRSQQEVDMIEAKCYKGIL